MYQKTRPRQVLETPIRIMQRHEGSCQRDQYYPVRVLWLDPRVKGVLMEYIRFCLLGVGDFRRILENKRSRAIDWDVF